ncbi:protein LURP-one-related 10-like [Pyrus ussuriensis x Pyrus communis]|uniref:Protein LURP-one-related 10-like n=1 Tax=Pyrus ussuriensis x Pyrus communis TaxID=2448454 RepID=A0A5N5H8V9_9ROSA|nr:protein LURP-one-related 10-like [Pyrus ussuriensis x Pyrus communis]
MKEAEAGERLLAHADPSPSAYSNRDLIASDNPAAAIISPHFCSSHSMDLAIVRKVLTIREGNFVVADITGNMIFKVRGSLFFSLHDRRVLLDTAGYPIITLRKKLTSAHDRWQVYRGDSKETRDLIFSAKKSSVVQFKTTLDVFLAHNITEDAPDFKVKGSWHEQSCFICRGNSSTIVAQMHKKHTVKSVLLGKDNFMVTVYPGIDQAFIVALIVILDEINW